MSFLRTIMASKEQLYVQDRCREVLYLIERYDEYAKALDQTEADGSSDSELQLRREEAEARLLWSLGAASAAASFLSPGRPELAKLDSRMRDAAQRGYPSNHSRIRSCRRSHLEICMSLGVERVGVLRFRRLARRAAAQSIKPTGDSATLSP